MSASFTPGPWRQRNGTSTVVLRDTLRVSVATGEEQTIPYEIAYAKSAPGGISQRIANARLIAAAPKLHAALTLFEEQWNACGPNSDFGRYFQRVRDAAVEALSEADAAHWLNTSRAELPPLTEDLLSKARAGPRPWINESAYAEFAKHEEIHGPASGMSASGQDPKGLEAKPASPTGEAGDAQ